jgi:solute carrier family 45 protein 1/2/4
MYGNGLRLGSATYLVFSVFALWINLMLPWVLGPGLTHPRGLMGTSGIPYAACHIVLAICMCSTSFTKSWVGSATLIACTGVPWAMSQWAPFAIIGEILASNSVENGKSERMGTILGLHNASICVPQVLSAIVSSGILRAADGVGSEDGIAWVFGASALPALAAAYLTAMAVLNVAETCE